MGIAGRDRVLSLFTWRAAATRLTDGLAGLIEGDDPGEPS